MNFYLQKYGFIEPQINVDPKPDLGIIVVIPCYNEPDLITSLQSLADCHIPTCSVEVIVVINSGEHHSAQIKRQNQRTLAEFNSWKNNIHTPIDFLSIHVPNLPKKHAGVGLARKIGMDEAVARFYAIEQDGIIVCLDADSTCDSNYLMEIENHFKMNPKSPGCSIFFEHPISGDKFEEAIYNGITNYELHLRYYNQALKYAGLPYAFHTVGSSMAVRSAAYQKQGGMNKRKAGEDFYFIHKIIALGGFTELNTTRVIPSPRVSDRVPFGTGKAIGDWVDSVHDEFYTYNIKSFVAIKQFIECIPKIYTQGSQFKHDLIPELYKFLINNGLNKRIEDSLQNSTSFETFKKRFFVWFDAFLILKLVHYLRDEKYPNIPLYEASYELMGRTINAQNKIEVLLIKYRELERLNKTKY